MKIVVIIMMLIFSCYLFYEAIRAFREKEFTLYYLITREITITNRALVYTLASIYIFCGLIILLLTAIALFN